jgi:hypothetical protein
VVKVNELDYPMLGVGTRATLGGRLQVPSRSGTTTLRDIMVMSGAQAR